MLYCPICPHFKINIKQRPMKTILSLAAILAMLIIAPTLSEARGRGYSGGSGHVHVRGYTTKNGTYVSPHNRTSANHTRYDNYSTKGNVNPYTGKSGTVNPYK